MHGRAELQNAEEVAPGAALYVSRVEDALEAVLAAEAVPADFRLFVGHHEGLSTRAGEWCAVACAVFFSFGDIPKRLSEQHSMAMLHEKVTRDGRKRAARPGRQTTEGASSLPPPNLLYL